MSHVVPAVLPKSRQELAEKLAVLARIPGVSRIQIDVVDGKFAMPASWPYAAPGELEDMAARHERLPQLGRIEYEIDFMGLDPLSDAGPWLTLGASRLTFHAASVRDFGRLMEEARERYGAHGVRYGAALGIAVDPVLIESCVHELAYVQFMGIEAIGRQGEPFDPRALSRMRAFRQRHPDMPLQVDGGVSLKTAPLLLAAGVTDLVVGSAIVKRANPAAAFAEFAALAE